MFLSAEEFPLPYEYRWMPLDGASHELPPDAAGRTIVFLDCGNVDRMLSALESRAPLALTVNVDATKGPTKKTIAPSSSGGFIVTETADTTEPRS